MNFLGRLTRLGIDEATDPRLARRVIIANQNAIFLAIPCIPYYFLFRWLGARLASDLMPIIIAGYLATMLLTWKKFLWLARVYIFTFGSFAVLAFACLLGHGAGLQLLFLCTAFAAVGFFGFEERKSLLYCLILDPVLFLGFEIFSLRHGEWHVLSNGAEHIVHVCMVATTCLIQSFSVLAFYSGITRSENALAGATEAAKAADRAKGQFLANMSHEIRTPLNGIIGVTTLLSNTRLDESQEDMVETIQSSSLDLMGIVNEVLDISRIEAGKMLVDSAPFELRALMETVAHPFQYEARRRKLDFSWSVDENLPHALMGDAARIKQVLRNLIGNAFKFTEAGAVTLRIAPAERKIVLFSVQDTGAGIPADQRARLFQSFTQGDGSSTRKHGGSGLGLYICKQIVTSMGGEIGFESESGKGSRFYFTLPLREAALTASWPETDRKAPREEGPEGDGGPLTLVVDDHPINRKVLGGMLKSAGCRVHEAEGGPEGVDALLAREYDMVFMDLHMPVLDGTECTRRLRAVEEERGRRARAFVVGVTADTQPGARQRCLEAGMDDILHKPVLEKEFRRVIACFQESRR